MEFHCVHKHGGACTDVLTTVVVTGAHFEEEITIVSDSTTDNESGETSVQVKLNIYNYQRIQWIVHPNSPVDLLN